MSRNSWTSLGSIIEEETIQQEWAVTVGQAWAVLSNKKKSNKNES